MGSYAVTADIELLLHGFPGFTLPLGTGTTPTIDQVNGLIDQLEAEINGLLTINGYDTVPATGASDINMLKRPVAEKVAATIWHTAYLTRSDDESTPAHVTWWERNWGSFIKRLRAGDARLIDQTPSGGIEMGSLVLRMYEVDD